jgi:hypothetical protein
MDSVGAFSLELRRCAVGDSAAMTIFRATIWGAFIGLVAIALFMGLNYFSLNRGGEARVSEAFQTGALSNQDYRMDPVHGLHQFNDCLILGMALDQRYSPTELAISPSIPFETPKKICKQLGTGKRTSGRHFYHNYIHGHTMLVRYLLPELSVQNIREVYRLSITIILFIGIAISLFRIARQEFVKESACFLFVLTVFARFFGLETFGQSLGHGPSDFILVGFVVFLAISTRNLSSRALTFAGASFGALTMIFEFMTGGLPLGLAVIAGLSWFSLRQPNFRSVACALFAFLVAAFTCLTVKFMLVAYVFGTSALWQVGSAAANRVGGSVGSEISDPNRGFLTAILQGMDAMIPGLGSMAILFVIIAMISGCWALFRSPSSEAKLLAASNLSIFMWLAVFQQHTTIHAWFMDRMFVWAIASGFTIFGLWAAQQRSARI